MATSSMSVIVRQLCPAFGEDRPGITDGELLDRFLSHRDDAAVAAIVRRHAPMVWGVCHRILRTHHDAEDAFQATFLVLVRKGAAIRNKGTLANWLYGVARQTAVRLRAAAAKRGVRERQVADVPEPVVAEARDEELLTLLDEELSGLPERFRVLIVLCDLEGRTRQDVALQLGCPEGTVASRLSRARAMLARRFARHGVSVSGGMAAVASRCTASAPASVTTATSRAASLVAAGRVVSSVLISERVAALTEGVVKTMFVTKIKGLLAVLLAAGLVCGVSGLSFLHGPEASAMPGSLPAGEKMDDDKDEKKGEKSKGKQNDEKGEKAKGKKDGDKGEEKAEKLPKPVAEAVKTKFPKAKVVGVEKEDEDGDVVYEVKLKYKSGSLEVTFTPKGGVVKVVMNGSDEDDKDEKRGEDKKKKKGDDEDDKKDGDKKKKKKDDDE